MTDTYEILSLCRNSVKKTASMFGKTRKVNGLPEHKAVIREHKRDTIFDSPKILMKAMIHSDQLVVAEVLPLDWPEYPPDEQDESGDGSEAECDEREVVESSDNDFYDVEDDEEESEWVKDDDFSDAEMSSENKESLNNSDSDHIHHFSYSTEHKELASEGDYCENGMDENTVLSSSQNKEVMASEDRCEDEDESEWTEEDSDWSDEDSEIPAESIEFWNSFLNSNDPYNPLYFCPTEIKKQSSEIQQNHKPSSCSEDGYNPVPSTKKKAKKVCFSKEVTIHVLEEWPLESQAARDGSCWMEMAVDRHRFKRRVELTGNIISPCLQAQHRAKALEQLLSHSDLCFNNKKDNKAEEMSL